MNNWHYYSNHITHTVISTVAKRIGEISSYTLFPLYPTSSKLMFFLTTFAFFIFTFTVFEQFFLTAAAGVVLLILAALLHRKYILRVLLAFVIAFTATSIKQYRYFSQIPHHPVLSWNIIPTPKSAPQAHFYLGTGQVVDKYSQGRYIFSDEADRQYFLYSDKDFIPWSTIRLQGYVSLGLTGTDFLYSFGHQRKIIQNSKVKIQNFGSGFLNYQFNYPKRLMMKDLYGTIYERNAISLGTSTPSKFSFKHQISQLRYGLQDSIIRIYGRNQTAGLVLWMLIGDKSEIPKYKYQQFVDSGLVHIIAVSGGNIIMIVIFLSFTLFFVPFYLRNAIILCTVILYALLCGLDSSVIRATLMGSMGLLALFRWREINIRRALATAFVAMLIFNPYFLVYDVGFLLSFAAIIGLVGLSERQSQKQKTKSLKSKAPNIQTKTSAVSRIVSGVRHTYSYISKNYVQPTLWATLGVFPILIFFMGKLNLLGLLINIIVVPVVPFVMIYGLISTLLTDRLWRTFLLIPEQRLINYIYAMSEFAASKGIYLAIEGQRIKYVILSLAFLAFFYRRTHSKKNRDNAIDKSRQKNTSTNHVNMSNSKAKAELVKKVTTLP